MDLRQLRQVLVLAETLNFHRAAERLHMAQPPLSTSIRKLEEELGVRLFERLPTGLRLTVAGQVVLRNARRTLFFAEEIRRGAKEGETGEQGLLRVGIVGSAAYSVMPPIIRAFRRQYPRVDLVIEESTTVELLERLEAHSLDVALIRYPVLDPTNSKVMLLQPDNLLLAVSTDNPLAERNEVALTELADEPFIIYSRTLVPTMYKLMMHAFHEEGIQPRIAQEAVQVQTILGLVESGLGVALVPSVARKYIGSNVKLVPVKTLSDRFNVGIAVATHHEATTATAANFIALAHAIAQEGNPACRT